MLTARKSLVKRAPPNRQSKPWAAAGLLVLACSATPRTGGSLIVAHKKAELGRQQDASAGKQAPATEPSSTAPPGGEGADSGAAAPPAVRKPSGVMSDSERARRLKVIDQEREELRRLELSDTELARWLKDHNVRNAFRGHHCRPMHIGVPAADGVLCIEPIQDWLGDSTEWMLWRHDAHGLGLVWRGRRTYRNSIELTIKFAPDGAGFKLCEILPGICNDKFQRMIGYAEYENPDELLGARQICAERGRYLWNGKRFVRDTGQPICASNYFMTDGCPCPLEVVPEQESSPAAAASGAEAGPPSSTLSYPQ